MDVELEMEDPKMNVDFLKIVADALSTLTILSCVFLKVPQIVYIKEKQSAEGIYVQAMIMEIMGFTIMTLYNFTNSYGSMTYMEYPIILVQVYVMLYYTLKYKNLIDSRCVPILTSVYFTTVGLMAFQVIPKIVLSYLVPLCTPLSGFAKVTYMYGIVNTGNADAVSLTTWVISVMTNTSRVFTVYMDSADTTLLFNFVVSTMLSCGVLLTALVYQARSRAAALEPPPPPPTARAIRRRRSSRRRNKHD